MEVLRTPDAHFRNLPEYPFAPHYSEVKASDGTTLRMHHIEDGPSHGETVLCLHGQPSWSFLYRKMVPHLTQAGLRVVAPDLVGFGRSDKPANVDDYTYAQHVDWLDQWFVGRDLKDVTLFCQDWGGLLGLRVVARHPERFRRLVISNTGLPDSNRVPAQMSEYLGQAWSQIPVPDARTVSKRFASGAPDAFLYWVKYAAEAPDFSVRSVFGALSGIKDDRILNGYDAPFPDATYLAGARKFPSLVPLLPHHQPDREANDKAWAVLETFDRPVLTAFSDRDPVTRGGEVEFQKRIAGAKGRTHVTVQGAGHFLQEEKPVEIAGAIIEFIEQTS